MFNWIISEQGTIYFCWNVYKSYISNISMKTRFDIIKPTMADIEKNW